MAISFHRRINPVIPTTAVTVYSNSILVLVTAPFTPELITPRFVIQVDQAIPYGSTFPVALSDVDGDRVLMYDRFGNYIRADRLYRAERLRSAHHIPYCGCPNEFQCVLNFDPIRINVLGCIPPSVYVPTTTEVVSHEPQEAPVN